jgi:hypothetical protein
MSILYVGNTLVDSTFLGNEQVITNLDLLPQFSFRNDPFSASLVFATPGNLFTDFAMDYDWSDVSANIKGTGVNKSVLTASLSANSSLTNFASEGYIDSTFRTGSAAIRASDDSDMEFIGNNYTIELWFNPGTADVSNVPFFFDYVFGQALNSQIWCRIDFNKLSMVVDTNNFPREYIMESSALTWTANQWYHLCFQRNGNVYTVYRDGVVVAQSTLTSINLNQTSNLKYICGSSSTYTAGFSIQDYRIYNGAAKYSNAGFTPPASMVIKNY